MYITVVGDKWNCSALHVCTTNLFLQILRKYHGYEEVMDKYITIGGERVSFATVKQLHRYIEQYKPLVNHILATCNIKEHNH